jgi:hypothetical protein
MAHRTRKQSGLVRPDCVGVNGALAALELEMNGSYQLGSYKGAES